VGSMPAARRVGKKSAAAATAARTRAAPANEAASQGLTPTSRLLASRASANEIRRPTYR
jgi:hypothetical protein